MLNLKRIDLATDDDKKWMLDKWAALFKATTWEDLRMIAAPDKEMTIASRQLYNKNQGKCLTFPSDLLVYNYKV